MSDGLREFLHELVDYAGLFPPAKLPLEPAIRNFAAYRRAADAWMLGRFICPVDQLAALRPYHDELFAHAPPFRFSVLCRGGEDAEQFLETLRTDLATIHGFHNAHAGRVRVEALEIKVPAALQAATGAPADASAGDGYEWLTKVRALLESSGLAPLAVALEPTVGPDYVRSLPPIIAALKLDADEAAHVGGKRVGFSLKLRCGGVTAAAFPSVEQVAFVIAAARDAGVALKFTAGLHHPVRHDAADVQTKMHGFLNVLGAALLARGHGLPEATLREMIADEAPGSFRLDAEGFAWREWRISAKQIRTARNVVTSFGSCSFDEPRDDLRSLRILPA